MQGTSSEETVFLLGMFVKETCGQFNILLHSSLSRDYFFFKQLKSRGLKQSTMLRISIKNLTVFKTIDL